MVVHLKGAASAAVLAFAVAIAGASAGAEPESAGAQGMLEGSAGTTTPEALNSCDPLPPKDAEDTPLQCAINNARATAQIYRSKAEVRQGWTDRSSFLTATGLGGAVIGGAKAAASTSNAWVALGVLPIVAEDLSANEPRSRLYGLAAISLSRIVWRYQALDEARVKLNADLDDLRGRTRNVCGVKARLEAIKSAADRAGGKILFADQISRMTSRCAALTAALQQLSAASEQWGSSGDFVAHSFIKDAIEFDDTVARLDRSLRTTPAGAFRTVLATPFSVASNIIRGGADIQGYQQRTLSTFSNPIIFELTRLPDLPIPNAVPADLTRSESLREWAEEKPSATLTSAALETRGELRQQTEETCNDLNELALEVNALIAAAGEVKRMNDLSVLTINYSVIDRPVTLAPPAPKP